MRITSSGPRPILRQSVEELNSRITKIFLIVIAGIIATFLLLQNYTSSHSDRNLLVCVAIWTPILYLSIAFEDYRLLTRSPLGLKSSFKS